MEPELFISTNLNLLRAGGAIAGNSKEIAVKFFNSVMLPGPSRNVIVISSYLKDNLSDKEFKAIYYHELGHLKLNHNSTCKFSQEIREIQADAFAVKQVGPRVLLSALKKLPNIVRYCAALRNIGTVTRSKEEYSKSLNYFLEDVDKRMINRFNILEKQCNEKCI